MGIHKSQHTLMSHDNRKKKKKSQWYTASAKADIAYGKNWPKHLLFVVFFFFMSEIMQLEIFNRQHTSRPFITSNGLIVLLAEIKN